MAYRGLLRLAILMSVLSFSASDRVRGENVSTSGIPKPRTIHNYPMAGHAIDNDAPERGRSLMIFLSTSDSLQRLGRFGSRAIRMIRHMRWRDIGPTEHAKSFSIKSSIRTFLKTKVNGRHTVSPHTRLDIIFAYIWKPGRLIFVKPSFKRIITAGSFWKNELRIRQRRTCHPVHWRSQRIPFSSGAH